MKKIFSLVITTCFCCVPFLLAHAQLQAKANLIGPNAIGTKKQSKPKVTAKLLSQKCDGIPLPKDSTWPNWKEDRSTVATRVSLLSDCGALEEKFGQVAAVMTTFSNRGSSKIEIPIETFSSVTLNTQGGKKQSPVAIKWRTYSDSLKDYVYGVAPDLNGTLTMVLRPRETAYLIFFFPRSDLGETIQIGKLAPIKVASQ
jgi:hypothetical protein